MKGDEFLSYGSPTFGAFWLGIVVGYAAHAIAMIITVWRRKKEGR